MALQAHCRAHSRPQWRLALLFGTPFCVFIAGGSNRTGRPNWPSRGPAKTVAVYSGDNRTYKKFWEATGLVQSESDS